MGSPLPFDPVFWSQLAAAPSVPRIVRPLAQGTRSIAGAAGALGGIPSYLTEPVTQGGEPASTALPFNLEGYEPFPPPSNPTPNVDAAVAAYEGLTANRPSPDEAAAIFSGGAKLGTPFGMTPEWGGVDLGGNTGLTANQMRQDEQAHALIDRRYPMAGDYDPLKEQIGAAAGLRKLEDLLPADDRPLMGEKGQFNVEGGVIRNNPRVPISGGDESNLALLERKLGLQTQADIDKPMGMAKQASDVIGQLDTEGASLLRQLQQAPEYLRALPESRKAMEDQLRARIEAAKMTYMQVFGISSGHPPTHLYGSGIDLMR